MPVICAGAAIRAGDVVIADDDGVVVVPREDADTVMRVSRARIEKENETRALLAAGKLGLDIYGLRKKVLEMGLEYI